ncbi:MAG TPA: hypothetical protein VHB99_10325, partial [Pirellulales bacterium]|nr:hypothetical protein [Pirellulales bacterium]
MKLFLIIVGAVVTAFALCLLMLALWLRGLARKLGVSLGEKLSGLAEMAEKMQGAVPPLRVKLRPVDSVEWIEPEKAAAFTEELKGAEFEEIGEFELEPSPVTMRALYHPAEGIHAAVYQHPKAGVWFDLVARYEDGEKLTYTNTPDTRLERAKDNIIRFHPGASTQELLSRFRAERPAKTLVRVAPEAFPEYFERAYAEGMDWMIARGGPTEDEIRRNCESKGQEFTPALVTAVRGRWAYAIDEFYNEQLRERYMADPGVSAARWEQICDRVVFVHERMAPDRLDELCEREFNEEEDGDGLYDTRPAGSSLAASRATPRQVFARFN